MGLTMTERKAGAPNGGSLSASDEEGQGTAARRTERSDRLQPWYAVGLLNGAPMKAAVAPKRRAERIRTHRADWHLTRP
jgi:hypothetical protein